MTLPITITRSKLVQMRWLSHGQMRGWPIEPHAEVFHLWYADALLGSASEVDAAMLLAEHHARRMGREVDDAALETAPLSDRLAWPATPTVRFFHPSGTCPRVGGSAVFRRILHFSL